MLIAALGAGGLYFFRDWLLQKANRVLKEELAQAGIHVEYESVDYRALRGLIVKNIVFFSSIERKDPVLRVSDAACVFSPLDLLLGRPFSGDVTIRDGEVALVAGERETVFSELNATIRWLEDTINIRRMKTSAAGMEVDVKGTLVLAHGEGEAADVVFPDFSPVIDVMEAAFVVSAGASPQLSVELHTIQGGPHFPLNIEGTLTGEDFSWKGVQFGRLNLSARFAAAEQDAVFPAEVSLVGRGEGVGWMDISFGEVEFDAEVMPEERGTEFPVRITANVGGQGVKWDGFSSDSMKAEVAVEPSPGKSEAFFVRVVGQNSGFRWAEAEFEQVDFELRYLDEDRVAVDALTARGYGGVVKAVGLVSPLSNRMSLEKMESTADLITIAGKLDAETKRNLGGLRFTRNPKVTLGNSLLRFDDAMESQCHVHVIESGDVAVDIGDREIELKEVIFNATLDNGTLRVPDLQFRVMGGLGKAVLTIPLRSDPLEYQLSAAVEGVQVAQLADLTGADSVGHLRGDLNGNFLGKGGAVIEDFEGSGMVEVSNAKLYEARVLGPLWGFIRRHDERLRGDQEQEMMASFGLKEGVMTTEDFLLATSLAKLMAEGTFDLVHHTVNLDARMNLKGAMGLATAVASRVLEVHGEGHVDNIEFSLKNRVIGGVVKGGAGVVKTGVGVVRGGAGVIRDGAGNVLEGAGNVLQGTGEAVEDAGERMREAANALRPRNFLRRNRGVEAEEEAEP